MKLEQGGRTGGSYVMIELDGENDSIKLKNGKDIYIDTSFAPEKHITVTGVVKAIPLKLHFDPQNPNLMPWDVDMELIEGDRVVCHYLAIQNCFRPEIKRFLVQDGKRYVWLQYRSIFCAIRDDEIIPINGYNLISPLPDKYIEKLKERADVAGLMLAGLDEKTIKRVAYGKVGYTANPVRRYFESIYSDEEVDIKPGDEVVMRRITDIPTEQELHQTLGGVYWRVQRKDIFAILNKK